MSAVRTFFPEVRLKRLLEAEGGISVADAIAGAERRLDTIRSACLAGVDAKIELIAELCCAEHPDSRKRCYVISNEIFAEAGAFDLGELSAVAHSLCSLLSEHDRNKAADASIKAHVDAMRVLRRPSLAQDRALRRAVLLEIQALARRLAQAVAA